jgi:hypothetical protein
MHCEFSVPDGLTETPEPLRRALTDDPRWDRPRVTFVAPEDEDGAHLIVSSVPASDAVEDLARACDGIANVVTTAVPGAFLLACSRDD